MTDTLLALDRHKLQTQFKDAEEARAYLQSVPCDSAEARAAFDSVFNKAHQAEKSFTEERQELTRPLKVQVTEFEEPYRPLLKSLKELKELARVKVSQYDTAVALAAEASRNLAIAAAQSGDTEACVAALAAVPEEVPSSFEWVVVSTNPAEMSHHYLLPDYDALRKLCKLSKDNVDAPFCPGVSFGRRAVVRVKGK